MENRTFNYALLISFALHCVFVIGFSNSQMKLLKRQIKQIEVTYYKIQPKESKRENLSSKSLKVIEETRIEKEKFSDNIEIASKKEDFFSSPGKNIKDISKFEKKFKLDKKQAPKIKTLDMGRKIKVPILKSEKITNVKYVSYNQNIRQKIKQMAYSHIDHPDFEVGEVYLTFVLSADGSLKDIKIIEERTRANDYLRKIGKRSIKDASPFSSFPKDLNYPELTFNVVISFEIDE
ncbi:MAG: hypothetical protein P9X22_07915 [Candidatus Zapsychrus exili]|nr:hypothetical protein [Candidatus Zapsychrus exili]